MEWILPIYLFFLFKNRKISENTSKFTAMAAKSL